MSRRPPSLALYEATVVNTGPHFYLAEVQDGGALGTIKVSNDGHYGPGMPNVNATVLIGPVHFVAASNRPSALAGWTLRQANPRPKRTNDRAPIRRETGVVTFTDPRTGRFGQIVSLKGGNHRFVHQDDVVGGFNLAAAVGRTVTYLPLPSVEPGKNDRATQVRLA